MGKSPGFWATGLLQDYTTLSFLTRDFVSTEGEGVRDSEVEGPGPRLHSALVCPCVHLHSSWVVFGSRVKVCCVTRLLSLGHDPFPYFESSLSWKKMSIHRNLGVEVLSRSSEKTPFLRWWWVSKMWWVCLVGSAWACLLSSAKDPLARESRPSCSCVTEGCYLFRSWGCPPPACQKAFKPAAPGTVSDYRLQWLTTHVLASIVKSPNGPRREEK